jgi:hypothetical protein
MDNPIVNHNYFEDDLDVLVLAEGARFANDVVMENPATRDVIMGAWPENLTHHKNDSRNKWMKYVRENAFTGESRFATQSAGCS